MITHISSWLQLVAGHHQLNHSLITSCESAEVNQWFNGDQCMAKSVNDDGVLEN